MPEQRNQVSFKTALPDRWTVRLALATTPQEVVNVAAEYLHALDDAEHTRLPMGCAPMRMDTPEDVGNYAYVLTQAQLRFEGPIGVALLLDRMAVFFCLASTRIAHLSFIERAHT